MSSKSVKTKPIPVFLDKERHLLYDMNALELIEEEYESKATGNLSPLEAAFKALMGKRIKASKILLWAGLRWEEPTLTKEEVGRMVTIENMSEVSDAILKAVGESTPEPDPQTPPAANVAGAVSTGSGSTTLAG